MRGKKDVISVVFFILLREEIAPAMGKSTDITYNEREKKKEVLKIVLMVIPVTYLPARSYPVKKPHHLSMLHK